MKPLFNTSPRMASRPGFTLLEMLAAMSILALITVLLFAAFNQASRAWHQGENRVETFVQARAALDFMTRELAQAMVRSNISFVGTIDTVAFVAPVNATTSGVDLAEVAYSHNTSTRELLRGYSNWQSTLATTNTLADNIVLLQFDYVGTNGVPSATWSAATAPSGVQITLGVIDSRAAARLAAGATLATVINQSMQTFTTFVALPRQ